MHTGVGIGIRYWSCVLGICCIMLSQRIRVLYGLTDATIASAMKRSYGPLHFRQGRHGYATSSLVFSRKIYDDDKIIDVKVVKDDEKSTAQQSSSSSSSSQPSSASPLAFLKDTAKSVVSKVTGLFKKKEKDPVSEAVDQAFEQVDKVLGSRNPFINPMGAFARGILKPMMKQIGHMMQEVASQAGSTTAVTSLTQREALRLILRNEQCRTALGLSTRIHSGNTDDSVINSDGVNTIYYDKNGNQIFVEEPTKSSTSDDWGEHTSEWTSSPPFALSTSHMNINGLVTQRMSLGYQLSRNANKSPLAMVQVVATVRKEGGNGNTSQEKVAIEQLHVTFPHNNRTVRVR